VGTTTPSSTGALGTIGNPYPTINQALNAVQAIGSSNVYNIEVMAGSYTESTTVTVGNITNSMKVNMHFHDGANLTVTQNLVVGGSAWLTLSQRVLMSISGDNRDTNSITITTTGTQSDGFAVVDGLSTQKIGQNQTVTSLSINNMTITSDKTGTGVEFILIKQKGGLRINNSRINTTGLNTGVSPAGPFYMITTDSGCTSEIMIRNSSFEIIHSNATSQTNLLANPLAGVWFIYEISQTPPAGGWYYPRLRISDSTFVFNTNTGTGTGTGQGFIFIGGAPAGNGSPNHILLDSVLFSAKGNTQAANAITYKFASATTINDALFIGRPCMLLGGGVPVQLAGVTVTGQITQNNITYFYVPSGGGGGGWSPY
jgi:hypothetical protein